MNQKYLTKLPPVPIITANACNNCKLLLQWGKAWVDARSKNQPVSGVKALEYILEHPEIFEQIGIAEDDIIEISDVSTNKLAIDAGLKEQPGFDILLQVNSKDGIINYGVEVKGRKNHSGAIYLSANERNSAILMRERFVLAVVFGTAFLEKKNSNGSPSVLLLLNPFENLEQRFPKHGVFFPSDSIFESHSIQQHDKTC